jgi:hypothetical protein
MVDFSDVNDPNRIWNIPADWEQKFHLNREFWDHKEVMTPRGRMIVVTQIPDKTNMHHPYQFCTSIHPELYDKLDYFNSKKPLTANDVFPWEVVIVDDGFTEDGIEKALEFINE